MKTTSVLQLLLILTIFVSFSIQQAQNPNCQPIEATQSYKSTLFVFIVETSGSHDDHMKYVMKQLACSIPQAENIKSYILDYTDGNALVTVRDEDFSTSQQIIGKIANSLKIQPNLNSKCSRMETFQDSLSKQDNVKKYTNVKYILFMNPCNTIDLPKDWFLFDIYLFNNIVWFQRDSKHAVALQPSESDAPQLLKDASNKIVGTILEDDSLWQTPALSSSSNSSDSETWPKDIIYGIIIGVLVLALGASIFFIVWKNCKCKKNKNKKNESESSLLANDSGKPKLSEPIKNTQTAEDPKAKDKQVQKREKSNKSDQPTSGDEELARVLKMKDEEKRIKTPSTLSYSITLESEAPKKKNRK